MAEFKDWCLLGLEYGILWRCIIWKELPSCVQKWEENAGMQLLLENILLKKDLLSLSL